MQEVAIEEYFKPLDKEAEILMKMQLQGEEKKSEMMMKALEEQALLQKAEAEKITSMPPTDKIETNQKESEIPVNDSVHHADKPAINPILASTITHKGS